MISYDFTSIDKGLLGSMREAGIIRVGEQTRLASGLLSPIYVDMRDRLTDDHPELLPLVGTAFAHKIIEVAGKEKKQVIIGIPDAANPLVGATVTMAALEGLPISCLVQRKFPKEHGTESQKQKLVIGEPKPDREYNLLDDVITTSASKRKSIAIMENEGFKIKRVFVCFDRQQGGGESLIRDGYEFYAVYKLLEVATLFLDEGLIISDQYKETLEFIRNNQME